MARPTFRLAFIALISCVALPAVSAQATSVSARSFSQDASASVEVFGNGIGGVVFGTSELTATTKLEALLGKNPYLSVQKKDCSVDHSASWSTIAVFFSNHRFVGYYSAGLNREKEIDTATAKGLRVGNSIGRAEALYGKSFRISRSGLSWVLSTSVGPLDGNLLSTPKIAGQGDQITNITAGDVGCTAF